MRPELSVPLWLRWLLFFVLLGVVGLTVEGAENQDLVYTLGSWLVFVWLVLFPGRRPGLPRLFGVAMVAWILLLPLFVLLLVSAEAWDEVMADSSARTQPTLLRLMLLPYLVLFPALVLTLRRRLPVFRSLVVATFCYDALCALAWHAPWRGDTSTTDLWGLAVDVLLDVAVAAYMLHHFRAPFGAREVAET